MFYSAANWVAQSVAPVEKPWDLVPSVDPFKTFKDKYVEYKQWCGQESTKYHFVSGFVGQAPALRVTDTNPPAAMTALIVDYDAPISEDMITMCKVKPRVDFMPAYSVQTIRGHGRLVWLFEAPVKFASMPQAKSFLRVVTKELKLAKWLPGLDVGAIGQPQKYYALGKWTAIEPTAVIPKTTLNLWLYEASRKLSLLDADEPRYHIPLEKVREEIDRRFPGRWSGDFVLGARGVRFWDLDASDPTGAVVLEHGMMAFSGEQAFMSWRKIFGGSFVDRFQAERVSKITDKVVYDGQDFWLDEGDSWQPMKQKHLEIYLKQIGFNAARATGKSQHTSEIEDIIIEIVRTQRVNKIAAVPHRPVGVISVQGNKFLNTRKIRVLQPAPPLTNGPMTWVDVKKHCPFIRALLLTLFVEPSRPTIVTTEKDGVVTRTPVVSDIAQLEAVLSWLKCTYVGYYNLTPTQGQMIALAGPVGQGKTLFTRYFLAPLFGSLATDAASFLIGDTAWNDHLTEQSVWVIDDETPTDSFERQRKMTSRIKKFVANSDILLNKKYMSACMLPIYPRIVLLCNLDEESLSILPGMNSSVKEKISLFKTSSRRLKFPSIEEIQRMLDAELPMFARFLLDYNYPSAILAESRRYTIKSYHHPELLEYSVAQGPTGLFLQVLIDAMADWRKEEMWKGKDAWVGSGALLFRNLVMWNQSALREFKSRTVEIALGKLMQSGYPIRRERGPWGTRAWTISFKMCDNTASGWDIVRSMDDDNNNPTRWVALDDVLKEDELAGMVEVEKDEPGSDVGAGTTGGGAVVEGRRVSSEREAAAADGECGEGDTVGTVATGSGG